jgi:hypothetical protein
MGIFGLLLRFVDFEKHIYYAFQSNFGVWRGSKKLTASILNRSDWLIGFSKFYWTNLTRQMRGKSCFKTYSRIARTEV